MRVQHQLFDWMASQPGATGLAVFALGLCCALVGFRLQRLLVVLASAGLGAFVGALAAALLGASVAALALAGSALGGLAGVARPNQAVVATGAASWAALMFYLLDQLRFPTDAALIGAAVALVVTFVLTLLSRSAMTLLCLCLAGSALMVLGFVGVANASIPSLGASFRALAERQAIVVPVLIGMLTVTTYSHQANSRRGDLVTGGTGDARA